MTSTPGKLTRSSALDEESVAAYLRDHPEFLTRNTELLAELEVPHRPGAGATSLIERQVAVLRERNERLEQRLADLLRTARDNERVGAHLLALGRGLLEADSLDAVLSTVREALLNEFAADEVTIRLIDTDDGRRAAREPERFARPSDPEIAAFNDFLRRCEPVCGDVTGQQQTALFRDRAERIASAAIVPLRSGRALGVIGLGSTDPAHFRADMGTLFLSQLGELVSACIARHLDDG